MSEEEKQEKEIKLQWQPDSAGSADRAHQQLPAMAKHRRRYPNRPHLYILRGLPGSGKSRLARKINERYNGTGIILSTDDFFRNDRGEIVDFNRKKLREAHRSTIKEARTALMSGAHPVFIDNTNISRWEMRPYVEMGLRFRYHIRFCYARDSWRLSVHQLHRRIGGKVQLKVMIAMKKRYEFINSIHDVLYD